jgi:DNA-binding response OmpR family regulator
MTDALIVAESTLASLCQAVASVRRAGYDKALLAASADGSPVAIDFVAAVGADDYVVVPERSAELPYRLAAIIRRRSAPPAREVTLLDPIAPAFYQHGVSLEDARSLSSALTITEERILRYLMSRSGEWVSARELLAEVFECHVERDSGPVRVHISALRKKLSELGSQLESRRGFGYRWRSPGSTAGQGRTRRIISGTESRAHRLVGE